MYMAYTDKSGLFLKHVWSLKRIIIFRKSADTISGAAVTSNIDATGFQPTKMLCVRI